jgi:receptor expression-enhancing protein 1/2/3/4
LCDGFDRESLDNNELVRIPFYYLFKTLFLLYLALPQTRGASYLYRSHLQPFFRTHESQIDATLASLKVRVYTFLQERMRALWDQIMAAVRQQQQQSAPEVSGTATDATTPPGPVQLALNFWRSYGPSIIATGTALLRQTPSTTVAPSTSAEAWYNAPAAVASSAQSLQERRRELEAQLAALSKAESDGSSHASSSSNEGRTTVAMPGMAFTSSRASSSTDIRERTGSGGKFEEIEMPVELEGYEIGRTGSDRRSEGASIVQSWFGWKGGYDRVKTE